MKRNKKALVLGGTGAMGVYLVPKLAAMGCETTVVSLDDAAFDHPLITHVKADAMDPEFRKELLSKRFDAIIDFLVYLTDEFRACYDAMLQSADHYFFLSTYRVYSGAFPITEETPRLLDVSEDRDFLATEDYALYKAREEDILQNSRYDNWTIVRPAITYSKRRFQLVTLEAPVVVARALKGLPVIIPRDALEVEATMSWAGDVADMFAGLLFKPEAYRECFTLATAEHRTWGEIAEYYRELIGLQYVPVDTEDYLRALGASMGSWYQLAYDRLFTRIVDNSKALRVAGLKQENLMPLKEGLRKELSALPKDVVWPDAKAVWDAMDDYLKTI